MNKFIGIILGAAAVVACSKSSVEYSAPTELTLSPVTEVSKTRAAVSTTEFPSDWIIGVYAKNQDLPATTSAAAFTNPGNFLNNVRFANFEANLWAGTNGSSHTPYYWPRTGSIVLAAYSPWQTSGISYSFAADGTNVTTDSFSGSYSEPFKIADDNSVDLLWSSATSSSYNSGPVDMKFYHATAWLTFRALSNDTQATQITITGINISKVNTKGDFATSGSNINWTNLSEEKTIDVFTGSKEATANFQNFEDADNGVLVIPQVLDDDVVATISYEYYYLNGGSPRQSSSISIQLNQLQELNTTNFITEWEAGKHYILNIVFGASDEIEIAPSIEPWKEVTAKNVAVL